MKTMTILATLAGLSAATIAAPAAFAETTAPAATSSATAKPASDADRRAKEADCSKQANAKKLHGEARLKFREDCKKK